MTVSFIRKLKKKFISYNIDGYIIPKNDEFFSEYSSKDRLKLISNFSGSAGFAIILKKRSYLFVDGRYTIQAEKESGKNFKIIEIPKSSPKKILKNLTLGLDPKLFTSALLKNFFSKSIKFNFIYSNLVDEIFKQQTFIKKPFFSLSKKVVGESHYSKINKVRFFLRSKKADFILITAPENVAWILNIRGYDSPYSPMPNCYLLLGKKNELYLVSEKRKALKLIKEKKITKSQLIISSELLSKIKKLNNKNFIVDSKTCSIFYEKIIKSKCKIIGTEDPCYHLKSIKNNTELKNMSEAHFYDGLALTRFIFWLKNNKRKRITEFDAQNKLEKFRKLNKNYLFPSFDTIAGSGANAAIVHYRASKKNTKILNKKKIFLCDSGGQYKYGTTDVTRTICFSKPEKKIKDVYTKVLKGHIAVFNTDLKKDFTGKKIDIRARKFLKNDGLDYNHGTGHGVGFFSNVHEGPQSISKHNSIRIKEGMILSNEPGYYKKDHYGVRIENLIYVKKKKNKLYFENLTFAPIEKDLINSELLNKIEKDYLFKYHFEIYLKYSKFLSLKEKRWLVSFI